MQICLNCLNSYQNKTTVCPYCGFGSWHYTPEDFCLDMGILLKDRYKIGTKIGAGGFGITYHAVDMNNGRPVAIKEYFPTGIVTRKSDHRSVQISVSGKEQTFSKGISNFLEEAKGLARFRGIKNIVQVYDYFEQNGTAYIVMEYLRGRSLSQMAAEQNGRIDYNTAIKVMSDVLDALEVVHSAGMVHRDISPDNIFIRDDGIVKLIDFGAARESWGVQDKTLSIVLKPGYAPPEQFRKKSRQGPWTDIYALGATMYKLLTGIIPPESVSRFVEDDLLPPSVYVPGIPQAFDAVIMRMMSLAIEDRYQSVSALRNDLNAANGNMYQGYNIKPQSTGQIYGNNQNPVTATQPKKKKNTGLMLLIGTVAVMLIILIFLLVVYLMQDDGGSESSDEAATTEDAAIESDSYSDSDEGSDAQADGSSSFVDYGYFIYEWEDTMIYIADNLFEYSVEEIIESSTLSYEPLTSDEDNHEYIASISLGPFDTIDIDGDADYTQACMIWGDNYTDADAENVLNELEHLYNSATSSSESTYLWEMETTYILYKYDDDGIYLIYMTPDYWDTNSAS